MNELKVSDLLDEIESRLRRIIREEVKTALLESKNPNAKIDYNQKPNNTKSETNIEFPTIITAPEVAKLINVSVARVYEIVRARKTNGFPVIVLGERQYRFSREAVLKWLERDME